MSSSVVRPTATTAVGDGAVVPSGDADDVTRDNSTSSYVRIEGTTFWVLTCPAPTDIPETARIVSWQLNATTRNPGIGTAYLLIASDAGAGQINVTWNGWINHVCHSHNTDQPPSSTINILFRDLDAITYCDIAELYFYVNYVAIPALTVTAPTGTITETNRPSVVWTPNLDALGGSQAAFEVKIFDSVPADPDNDTPVVTSGIEESAAATWTPSEGLVNDTYYAYVRIAQTVNGSLFWSDWDDETFTLDVDLPAVPTVEAAADSTNGRIMLTLATGVGGETSTTNFEVQRSTDDGTTWEDIRTLLGDGIVDAADTAIQDYETANGESAIYRIRGRHVFASGDISVSAWSAATDPAFWTSDDYWLKHPADPSKNLKINQLASYPGKNTTARHGVHQALGASRPVVISDTRGGPTGKLAIRFDSDAMREAFDALLAQVSPLLVQLRPADSEPDRWVVFDGQDRARYVDAAWMAKTKDELDWIEVDSPPVNLLAWSDPTDPDEEEGDLVIA